MANYDAPLLGQDSHRNYGHHHYDDGHDTAPPVDDEENMTRDVSFGMLLFFIYMSTN